jgi:hypothetical protein
MLRRSDVEAFLGILPKLVGLAWDSIVTGDTSMAARWLKILRLPELAICVKLLTRLAFASDPATIDY